jgi:oxygen-dependent protoporphyrinogen oxidase
LFVRVLEPLLAGVHSGNAGRLSMTALHPRYLIRIPKMRAQKSLGAKTSPFLSLKDGMGRIPERIVEALICTKIYTNSPVAAVTELSEDAAELQLASGKTIDTDIVLMATPAYVSAKILRRISPKAATLLLQIPYASTAVASFLFPAGTLTGSEIGTGFLIPSAQQGVLSGCTVVSSKWSGRVPDNSVLIRVFIGNADTGEDLVRREHLLDDAEAELRSILRISEPVRHREITIWANGVPQYEIGHLDRIEMLRDELAPHSNLKVVGAAFDGMGIPDCIRQARIAAEVLVKRAVSA